MGDWGAVQLVRSKRSDYRSGEDIEFNRVIDRLSLEIIIHLDRLILIEDWE
jgi:hypothetical protein